MARIEPNTGPENDQRFPREARILSRPQFDRVFNHRSAVGNSHFRIHFAPAATPRLGQVISRRMSRRAVDRNRIRRIVRESFRLNRSRIPAFDLVVLPRGPVCVAADNDQLFRSLDQLWKRIIDQQSVEQSQGSYKELNT